MAKIKLNKQKRTSLQQASIFFFAGLSAIILLALLTYDVNDPNMYFDHSGETNATTQNRAGGKGAIFADFLFGYFGYVAYLLPIVLIALGLTAFRLGPHKKNPNNPRGGINAVITIFGALFAFISATALATLLDDGVWDGAGFNSAGGKVGYYISLYLVKKFPWVDGVYFCHDFFIPDGNHITGRYFRGAVTEKVGDISLALYGKVKGTEAKTTTEEGTETPKEQQPKQLGLFAEKMDRVKGLFGGLSGKMPQKPVIPTFKNTPEVEHAEEKLSVPPILTNSNEEDKPKDGSENAPVSVPVDSSQGTVKKVKTPNKAVFKNRSEALPSIALLDPEPEGQGQFSPEATHVMMENIEKTLGHYGVKIKSEDESMPSNMDYFPGPVVTRFEFELAPGTKVSKVSNLAKDLARNLGVPSVRIVEVIPGKKAIGLEVPNEKRDLVAISEVLKSESFNAATSPTTLALGKDISGIPVSADLAKMPHLLVAGTTGSGKSVAVNVMLVSMLYKALPNEVRLILIDPKMLELNVYEGIPHLLTPVVTDMKDAANALRWCVAEMERRYLLMSKLKVRNVAGFNAKIKEAQEKGEPLLDPLFDPTKHVDMQAEALEPLPSIVVVIDEFADMMMVVGKKVEELIARLAQKARASGIHLILATQRPSVDVITGLIKANIPSRIGFQVSTKVDSRTVLDQGGAEQLLGHGDMLYLPPGSSLPQRIHGAFVGDEEVERVVQFLKQQGEPDYIEEVIQETGSSSDAIPGLEPLSEEATESDPLYDEAVAVVTDSRRASISYLQRRLKVGYNRAARMIEDMEVAGVVSAVQSNGTREVLAPPPVKD